MLTAVDNSSLPLGCLAALFQVNHEWLSKITLPINAELTLHNQPCAEQD